MDAQPWLLRTKVDLAGRLGVWLRQAAPKWPYPS